MDAKRPIPRHIIVKMPKVKDKERILKAVREKKLVSYKGIPIRLSADFSKEALQARKGWKEVFKVMKVKDLHPRLFYVAKISFKVEGQIRCFPDCRGALTQPPRFRHGRRKRLPRHDLLGEERWPFLSGGEGPRASLSRGFY